MKDKILISGLISLLIGFISCDHYPLHRIFLIPSDYQGTLRIVYGEKCGLQPKEENGKEVVEFHNNGVVILAPDIDNRTKNDFYLIDHSGSRTKVNHITDFRDRVDNMPAILEGGIVYTSSVVSNDVKVSGGATCLDFALYNKDTIKIADSKLSKGLDSLTNSVVNACRKN